MDDANRVLATADVAMEIIGANDIVNPDAEEDKSSPFYGMPIFRPWTAKSVFRHQARQRHRFLRCGKSPLHAR